MARVSANLLCLTWLDSVEGAGRLQSLHGLANPVTDLAYHLNSLVRQTNHTQVMLYDRECIDRFKQHRLAAAIARIVVP